MCRNAADRVVGMQRSSRPKPAWLHVYRAVNHTLPKELTNPQGAITKFPQPIRDFVEQFVEAKEERERANYDPIEDFTLSDTSAAIRRSRSAIESLRKAEVTDRKAFAVFVLLGKPKS